MGLGGSWGNDTAQLAQRQVAREAMAQRLSGYLHSEMKATDVSQMPEQQWARYNTLSDQQLRGAVIGRMRAMEGYDPAGSIFSQE